MNGKLRVCRKCLPGQKNEEAFYEDLSRYIQRMDEELKVDQQTYEKRLGICSSCERLMSGMCRLCGCFVELRAVQKVRKMSGSAGKMGGAEMKEGLKSSLLNKVKVTDKFWRGYQELVMDTVIPYQEKILNDEIPGVEKSHALANFRIAAGLEEGEFYGMVFQDSDVAKWLEGVAYALEVRPDAELEERADKVIEIIEKAQQDDGYLNTFFTIKESEHRWQNLQECHELYCAGHMMEAAAAYYEVTGKDRLLHVMERMAEHIGKRFGTEEGKEPGIPGHQEIELGLLRL